MIEYFINLLKSNNKKPTSNKFLNKIIYPKKINYSTTSLYNNMKLYKDSFNIKKPKKIYLKRIDKYLYYESPVEKKLLLDLDNNKEVKDIKTQSLLIYYKNNGIKKNRKYYPDFQVLMKDNSIVIVEIKSKKGMVDYKSINKYLELKEYCKEYGFGYCMIDNNYFSMEDLYNIKVSKDKETKFIKKLKRKELLSTNEYKNLIRKLNIKEIELYKIILDNYNNIRYHYTSDNIEYK